jgi:uncharacterized protein YneR
MGKTKTFQLTFFPDLYGEEMAQTSMEPVTNQAEKPQNKQEMKEQETLTIPQERIAQALEQSMAAELPSNTDMCMVDRVLARVKEKMSSQEQAEAFAFYGQKDVHKKDPLVPLTVGNFEEIINSPEHNSKVDQYRATGDKKFKESLATIIPQGIFRQEKYDAYLEDHEAQQQLLPEDKRTEPKGPRIAEAMEPSGRICLDFDSHDAESGGVDAHAILEALKQGMEHLGLDWEDKLQAYFITPSGKGAKAIMERQKGMTIEEEYDFWSTIVGHEVDPKCADIPHAHFLPKKEDILHLSPKFFQPHNADPADYPTEKKGKKENVGKKLRQRSNGGAESDIPVTGKKYGGVPLEEILKSVEEQLGGAPIVGQRNQRIFLMACAMKHVADYDQDTLLNLIPTYGLDPNEHRNAIASALSYQPAAHPSAYAAHAIAEYMELKAQSMDQTFRSTMPQMPDRLPNLIQDFLSDIPEHLRPAMAMTIFPPLMAHFTDTLFHYSDNKDWHPNCMVILTGEQASGKGAVNLLVEYIMADIKASDTTNRQKEEKWKEQCRRKGENAEKPQCPQDIPIQWIDANCTEARFCQLLAMAQGRRLYTSVDEIELLKKIASDKIDRLHETIRVAYDSTEWGSERKGIENTSSRNLLFWNWNASCTPGALRAIFGTTGVKNGTLSRTLVSGVMTDPNEWSIEIPQYGDFGPDYAQKIQPYIERIKSAKGIIRCDEALEWSKTQYAAQVRVAEEHNNRTYMQYARRSVHSAFRIAMTLYVMNNYQWTQEIEDFASWVCNADLWFKMYYFSDIIDKADKEERCIQRKMVTNIRALLPETFTREDLISLLQDYDIKSQPSDLLSKWQKRGNITFDPRSGLYTQNSKNK